MRRSWRSARAAVEEERCGSADDVAEHKLSRGGVLGGVYPLPLLVFGDQPASDPLDPRVVVASAVRAPPSVPLGRPARTGCAQLFGRERATTTETRARGTVRSGRDNPWFAHAEA
jgi:hypothetical protein